MMKQRIPREISTETAMESNENNAVIAMSALVYPQTFKIMPCAKCSAKADGLRAEWKDKHQVVVAPQDGSHQPYTPAKSQSAATMKKNKAACTPVKRTAPNPEIHTAPVIGNRNPYAVCGWDGICTKQDICCMLQERDDPANPNPANCICHLTEDVPKNKVACLDWVNRGVCTPREEGAICPYAHPDLTEVHHDVCCNYLLTGICRFCISGAPGEEKKQTAAPDVRSKKRHGRSRGPSDCMGCHCVAEPIFPLLPGLTKKILRPLRHEGVGVNKKVVEWDRTDLDRALDHYRAFLGRY